MHHTRRRLGLALVLATLATTIAAGVTFASHEPSRFGLTPIDQAGPYFDLTMEPGETRRLEIELANFGHDEGSARTYAADVYSIINGGFGAELFGDDPEGTTLWLDYEGQEVTLAPRDAIVIEFAVAVPEGTPPGEYVTSLVAENAVPFAPSPAAEGFGINQVNRTAIAVAIDVPGPREPSLEIGAVAHKVAAGMSFVTFEVRNTGNVHVKPAGEFILLDSSGAQRARYEPAMDSVYAGTSTLLEAPLSSELAVGDYCAELTLTDAETGVTAATDCQAFRVLPPAEEANPGGSGGQPIPLIEPMIEAAMRDPRILGAWLILAAAVGTITLLLFRSRSARLDRARRRR